MSHGTNAGYLYGCRLQCCRDAHAAYRRSVWRKRYVRGVDRLYIDATGTIRRIRALQVMGWRYVDIDRALGRTPSGPNACASHNITNQAKVHVDTARAVAAVYERLAMQIGPSTLGRTRAIARGWPPPFCWDDETIDNPAAEPDYGGTDTDIDPVVVMRLLEGVRVTSTKAEKEAAMARWVADGGARNELARWHGWQQGRYTGHLRVVEDGAA